MKNISGQDLQEKIYDNKAIIDKIINIKTILEIDITNLKKISLKNCTITGNGIFFYGHNEEPTSISFINCTFKNEQLDFSNCSLKSIYISETSINTLRFSSVNINYLTFINECKVNIFDMFQTKINYRFSINRKNEFKRIIISNSIFNCEVSFFNSIFKNVDISHSSFNKNFNFNRNKISSNFFIESNNFKSINFDTNNFSLEKNSHFRLLQNNFDETVYLSSIKAHNTALFIKNNTFNEYTRFNNSIFKELVIDQTNFNNISSFQDTKFECVNIDRTNFEKPSFFDDIVITKIEVCNKRTLRNIKQQLQRTNNKIDYDIFNAYEINSYRKELKNKKKYWWNDKDAFILMIGNLFSKNGMNWARALIVTLIGSFLFYSVFYWIFKNQFQFTNLDFSQITNFINGFTRFLIPTNIYNPLNNNKIFVTGISWIPFILGKIYLSIGIYEVIKSFRKFKN